MAKNANETPRGRGRPPRELNLPRGNKFTVSAIHEANPQFKARLSVYIRINQLVEEKVLKRTNETVETGKVGKPPAIFWKMGAWNAFQKLRKSAKAAKAAKVAPTVDLTEAPVEAPVEAPAEAVTA
jgi:hypothetical protein